MRRLIALALLLAACVTPRPTVTATPSPTEAVVATASPSAAPTPTPTLPPVHLGLVFQTADLSGLILRTEGDPQAFSSLAGGTYPVVSPDGRRLAFWHRDNGAPNTKDSLHAIELLTGEEIELVRLDNELAGGIAWRDDGVAVVFSATSPTPAGVGLCAAPQYTAIRTVEVGSRQAREIKRLDKTRFVPLSWSAAARVVSGQDACEGLNTLFRFREDGSSAGDTLRDRRFAEVVDVATDAKMVLAQFSYGESGKIFSGIRIVGADSPRPIAEREVAQGMQLIRARFRPGTGDVVALLTDAGKYAVDVWQGGTTTSRRVWTSATAAATSGDLVMRVDGKAAYVRTDAPSGSSWQTLDLDSGVMAAFIGRFVGGPWFFGPSFYVTDSAIAKLRR